MTWNWFFGVFLAAAVAWVFHRRWKAESVPYNYSRFYSRASILVEPLLIPLCMLVLFIVFSFSHGIVFSGTLLASCCTVLVLYISIYYTILLCLLPLLRRWISPRACAALWLLPNLLYLTIYVVDPYRSPLLVLTLPQPWFRILVLVWAVGFVVVQLWQIISHLRFRKQLLRDAVPVQDPAVLAQWEHEQKRRSILRPIPMVISNQTVTPLTIGFSSGSLRLVLPHVDYTPKELSLIFRHELRHIERADTRTKAFLGFCAALCWFNPLVWIARRKAADDLELSCDELVLTYEDPRARQDYARLLLNTTASGTGYTTCLSAAASSLRYRLKRIVSPRKCTSGSVVVGLALLLLVLGNGSIALADRADTVGSLVLGQLPSDSVMELVALKKDWGQHEWDYYSRRNFHGWDEEALAEYLSGLSVKKVYFGGSPSYSGDENELILEFRERTWWGEVTHSATIRLWGNTLKCSTSDGQTTYLLQETLDWAYLESLMDHTAQAVEIAEPPEMTVSFSEEYRVTTYYNMGTVLSVEQNGTTRITNALPKDPYVIDRSEYPCDTVRLRFSFEPQGDYEIRVETWDRTQSYTVSGADLTDHVLELAPYNAHYTVTGRFAAVQGTVYKMAFAFDVK